jgi:hypothetical protein
LARDVFGNEILLHTEGAGCYNPRPLCPRPRPSVIASHRDFNNSDGYVYVQNVYHGTHMKGVQPGTVRFLRVVESPEKRFWTEPGWNGQGVERPGMNWHDFNNKRILAQVSHDPHETRINRASDLFGTTKSPRFPVSALVVQEKPPSALYPTVSHRRISTSMQRYR